MKKVADKRNKLEELRDVDAKLGGLPLPGRIWPSAGPARLGDGITTWTGWTRYRYHVAGDPGPNADTEYQVDEALEVGIQDTERTRGIEAAKLARCRALVARATSVAATPGHIASSEQPRNGQK